MLEFEQEVAQLTKKMADLKSVYGRKIDRLELDVRQRGSQTKKVFKKVRSAAIHCLQHLD